MSSGEEYTPSVPPVTYTTNTFNIGTGAIARETLAVLGHLSGVSITVSNGQIRATYGSDTHWTYSELADHINYARSKAAENLEYVRRAKESARQNLNSAIERERQNYESNIRQVDDAIHKLEELRNRANQPMATPSYTFKCDEDVRKIDKEIAKLKAERARLEKAHQQFLSSASAYSSALNNAATTSEFSYAESLRPNYGTEKVNVRDEVNEISKKTEERLKLAQAYCDAVNKLYEFVEDEDLNEYRNRLDDKVPHLDPFDKDSIKTLNELVNTFIQERNFKLQDNKNDERFSEIDDKVRHQLDVLRNISETLRPILVNISENEEEEVDVSEANSKLLNTILDSLSSIENLDYLSRDNADELQNKLTTLRKYRGNLNNPQITVQLMNIAKEVEHLVASSLEENEKYQEYQRALDKYIELREKLLGADESSKDIKESSKYVFTMDKADELIEELNARVKEMEDILVEIYNRSFIASAATAVGPEKIYSEDRENVGFTYVREQDKGAIFVVEKGKNGARITPKGVVLSNGMKTIDEEGLRKVHSSCEWSRELKEKLEAAGLPSFESRELVEEKEELYKEENYYHITSDKESIRFLRLSGYTDEEITNIFGYDVVNETYVGNRTEEEHRHGKANAIDPKEND